MVAEIEIVLRLVVSVILGLIIGAERELYHKPAGLRTNALVSMGACMFTLIPIAYLGSGYSGIVYGIVTGVGFLGAGAILNSGKEIKGMTSAATLWVSAAIGIAVGSGAYLVAAVVTLLAFIILNLIFLEEPLKRMKK